MFVHGHRVPWHKAMSDQVRAEGRTGVRLLIGLAAMAMGFVAMTDAAAPAFAANYQMTVPATVKVEVHPDGGVTSTSSSTRFETFSAIPDTINVGTKFPPRLAVITQTAITTPDDRTSRITVTVDDLSGPALRQVTRFSDSGESGEIHGGRYFAITTPGCCALPARHRVRSLESGKLLFDSSGTGTTGAAAWMAVANAKPGLERWVAFDGTVGKDNDPTKLGELVYGDSHTALSHVVVRLKHPDKQLNEFQLDAATCGFILWVAPGSAPGPGKPSRPKEEQCSGNGGYAPASFAPVAHRDTRETLGGYEVELSVLGKPYVTIPISDDRLDVANARVDETLVLTETKTPRWR
jgi:hypothetical protein